MLSKGKEMEDGIIHRKSEHHLELLVTSGCYIPFCPILTSLIIPVYPLGYLEMAQVPLG